MEKEEKITEKTSHYDHLEKMSMQELLTNINREDQGVPTAVEKCIPQIQLKDCFASFPIYRGSRFSAPP